MRPEPPPCLWRFPPPDAAGADGLLAVGADLEPGTLVAAYRAGIFPMPVGGAPWRGDELAWFSPDPRGVVPLDDLHVSRSLRRSRRRYTVTLDHAFDAVVAGCADPRRPGGWISPAMRAAYARMHALGWAHSVEVWDEEGLAGGLYGVELGGLFAAESKFHVRTDASKVALVALVERLRAEGSADRLLDVQWTTPHLRALGARDMARPVYLRRLAAALDAPPALAPTP